MRFQAHLLAAFVLTACGGSTPAPVPPAPGPESEGDVEATSPSADSPRLAGGYSKADTEAEDIKATADRAVTLLRVRTGDDSLSLQRIESAETQVVAGRNSRLTLALTTNEGERTAAVVIYRDLQGEESLTKVEGL